MHMAVIFLEGSSHTLKYPLVQGLLFKVQLFSFV